LIKEQAQLWFGNEYHWFPVDDGDGRLRNENRHRSIRLGSGERELRASQRGLPAMRCIRDLGREGVVRAIPIEANTDAERTENHGRAGPKPDPSEHSGRAGDPQVVPSNERRHGFRGACPHPHGERGFAEHGVFSPRRRGRLRYRS
jgi:hypothetical protein